MKYKATGKIRFISIFVAILCLILLYGMPHSDAANSDSEYETFRLEPIEDAYVDSEEPYTNFGEDYYLRVGDGQYTDSDAYSYLKFDLSPLPGHYRVLDATLKIDVSEMSSTMEGVSVYPSSNDWTEMDIRYVSRPSVIGERIDYVILTGYGGEASIDLSDYITKDTPNTITLCLSKGTNADGWIRFDSSDTYSEPELVINVEILNQPPTADFDYTPSNPTANSTITFTDTSTDTDGTIANCKWNFGDGTTGHGQTTNHTYTAPGTYDVTLIVTDNDGDTDTYVSAITVEEEKEGGTPGFGLALLVMAIAAILLLKRRKRGR